MAEDNSFIELATPTRFLIENGEWDLTPSITGSIQHEINPFDDCNYQLRYAAVKAVEALPLKSMSSPPAAAPHTSMAANNTTNVSFRSPEPEVALIDSPPTPPMSLCQSPASSSTASFTMNDLLVNTPTRAFFTAEMSSTTSSFHTRNAKSRKASLDGTDDYAPSAVQAGCKRRIVFEGDDAQDRRKKFLERNRVAAYKCRQKKKTWVQDLEKNAEIKSHQNQELKSLVAVLKEESVYLRNLLLTHSNCHCESVQAYLRKQSAEITNNTMPLSTRNSLPSVSQEETLTGLTPFFTTVIDKAPQDSLDYFSASHHQVQL